jgi:Ca2+-binding RTX toxin-like protein
MESKQRVSNIKASLRLFEQRDWLEYLCLVKKWDAPDGDAVRSQVTYTLGDNLESLILTGTSVINGTGNSLNNTVIGNSSNNNLVGGEGNDTLTGNGGSDRFMYDTNAAFTNASIGLDRVTDFTLGSDKLVLDKTTFAALTSVAGNSFSVSNEFAVVADNAAVAGSEALIVYSSGTGDIFYNQNGSAADFGSGGQFASLDGIPALSASDFILRT